LLQKKIVLFNPIVTYIQHLKNKENLKVLFLLSVFLCLIISPRATATSSWEITPENPVVGDIMEIKGTGFTGENAEIMVTFEKEVQVIDGNYEYTLENVVIPGTNNSYTVQATGTDELNVRAKTLLWTAKSAEAKDGVATVSQEGVPAGTYTIRIDGTSNASSVKLKITAIQEVEVDSEGNISYEYDTNSIPAGNFEVKIGDSTKQVELQSSENISSEITSSEKQSSNEENSWNNLKFILSYPYSLRSFYTVNDSIRIIYKGPKNLGQQRVNIYLVKERNSSCPENYTLSNMNGSTISLDDVLNNSDIDSYVQIPATLNENGDLSPLTLGSLPAGNYWVIISLAGNETGKPELEKDTLFAKYFEVLKYEMEVETPDTVEGENFEVNMSLKNASLQNNYIYWTLLINENAYKTDESTNSSWTEGGIRPIVNGVDIIKYIETNLTKYESGDKKEKLEAEIQALVGKENGTISIGKESEENQSTLSLESQGLPSGDYLLIAGVNENKEGLVGIAQKKVNISANLSELDMESGSENSTSENTSLMKKKTSPFIEVNSILETPKSFIFGEINQIFK
jgi:methanogen extracellular protein (TIGR04279 family)